QHLKQTHRVNSPPPALVVVGPQALLHQSSKRHDLGPGLNVLLRHRRRPPHHHRGRDIDTAHLCQGQRTYGSLGSSASSRTVQTSANAPCRRGCRRPPLTAPSPAAPAAAQPAVALGPRQGWPPVSPPPSAPCAAPDSTGRRFAT